MTRETHPYSIATIIVNYGAGELIVEHMEAILAAHDGLNAKIYIVDNASPGGDGAMLSRYVEDKSLSHRILVMEENENHGFAKGNNMALRQILADGPRPDFVFLLNPDAYVLGDGLAQLAKFLTDNPKAGIAGSKLVGRDGDAQISAFRFFSLASEFTGRARTSIFSRIFAHANIAPDQRDETYPTDWVCGASMLIRTAVFDDIGLFDEAYFLYYAETDFMLQAARHGWETWYVHSSQAVHLVGQSTGVKDGRAAAKVIPPYVFESRRHYFRKNHGVLYTVLADCAWLLGSIWFWITRLITRRDTDNAGANIKAFLAQRFSREMRPVAQPREHTAS